jgi:hypothetical protein
MAQGLQADTLIEQLLKKIPAPNAVLRSQTKQ